MHVETVDAAPLTFDLRNTKGVHRRPHDVFASAVDLSDSDDDFCATPQPARLEKSDHSPDSRYHQFDHDQDDAYDHLDDDDDHAAFSPMNISPEELATYFATLADRKPLTIPPVQKNGLPSLESMNIPHYNAEQVKTAPTEQQQKVLRSETLRGPKYLISFAVNKLNYQTQKLTPAEKQQARSIASSTASTISSAQVSLHTTTGKQQQKLADERAVPSPSKPAQSKSVFFRLGKKMNALRNNSSSGTASPTTPPSPAVSEEPILSPPPSIHQRGNGNGNGNGIASPSGPSSHYGSLSPISTFSSATSAHTGTGSGNTPLLQSPVKRNPRSIAGSVTSGPALHRPSFDQLAPTATTATTKQKKRDLLKKREASAASAKIKKSHKYLTNVGTLQIQDCDADNNADATLPTTDFPVIIDPRFEYSFIDIDAVMAEASRAGRRDLLAAPFHVIATPVFRPESRHNRVVVDVKLVPIRAANMFSATGIYPVAFDPPPQEEQAAAAPTKVKIDDGFSEDWFESSKRVVSLMDIKPHKCILGRDWLECLQKSADKATLVNEMFAASLTPAVN